MRRSSNNTCFRAFRHKQALVLQINVFASATLSLHLFVLTCARSCPQHCRRIAFNQHFLASQIWATAPPPGCTRACPRCGRAVAHDAVDNCSHFVRWTFFWHLPACSSVVLGQVARVNSVEQYAQKSWWKPCLEVIAQVPYDTLALSERLREISSSFQSSSARLFDLLVAELLASRSLHTISFCGSMSSIWITSPNITESKFELGLSSRAPSNELNRHEPSARPTFIATQSILYSSRCIHPWHVGRNSKFCLHRSTGHVSITVTFFRCCRHVVLWKLVVQIWRIPQYVRTFYWSWRGARWSSCILMDLTELSWRARADRHHLTTWLFRGCPKVPQVILFWRLSNSVNWMSQISIRIPNESHPTGKTVTCNVRWRRFCSYFKIEISLKETSCRRTLFKEKWRLSALSEFSTSMIEVVLTTSSPTLVRTSPLPNATVLHPWARSSAAKPVPFRFSRREEIDIDLTFSNEFPALGREN